MKNSFNKSLLQSMTFLFFLLILSSTILYAEDWEKVDVGDKYFYYRSMFYEPDKVVVIKKYNDGDVKVRKPNGDVIIVSAKKLVSEEDNQIDFSSIFEGVSKLYELDQNHIYIEINNKCSDTKLIYLVFKNARNLELQKLYWVIPSGKHTRLKHDDTINFISHKYIYYFAVYDEKSDTSLNYNNKPTKLIDFGSKKRVFYEGSGDQELVLCGE